MEKISKKVEKIAKGAENIAKRVEKCTLFGIFDKVPEENRSRIGEAGQL